MEGPFLKVSFGAHRREKVKRRGKIRVAVKGESSWGSRRRG